MVSVQVCACASNCQTSNIWVWLLWRSCRGGRLGIESFNRPIACYSLNLSWRSGSSVFRTVRIKVECRRKDYFTRRQFSSVFCCRSLGPTAELSVPFFTFHCNPQKLCYTFFSSHRQAQIQIQVMNVHEPRPSVVIEVAQVLIFVTVMLVVVYSWSRVYNAADVVHWCSECTD